jgi:ribonuclease P protein component
VTKKLGGAVERNRIRRRLKEALRTGALDLAQPGFDYVVVARSAVLARPFPAIVEDFRAALVRLHAATQPTDRRPTSPQPGGKGRPR